MSRCAGCRSARASLKEAVVRLQEIEALAQRDYEPIGLAASPRDPTTSSQRRCKRGDRLPRVPSIGTRNRLGFAHNDRNVMNGDAVRRDVAAPVKSSKQFTVTTSVEYRRDCSQLASDVRLQSAGCLNTGSTDVAIDPGTRTSNCSEIAFVAAGVCIDQDLCVVAGMRCWGRSADESWSLPWTNPHARPSMSPTKPPDE